MVRAPKVVPRGKISVDKPFHKLMPGLSPHDAVELLNTAVRRKLAGLWCNGKEVDPGFFRTHLVLRARLMAKRRWITEIEATRALDEPVEAYAWQMDTKEIEAVLLQPDTRAEVMQSATAATVAAMAEVATARAELEQARAVLQAATEQMEKAEVRAQAAEARAGAIASETTTKPDQEREPRRTPGPKPGHPRWRLEAAAFTHQFFIEKNRGPSAGEVADHLQIKYDGWEPPESDIRSLLRLLIRD
jgi:hypothetical protein